MDATSKKIINNLHYMEERNGMFTLFHLNVFTGISVVRSHEGYNHFAQWYVKIDGKIKKSYEIKEREQALYAGYSYFIEKFSNCLLQVKEKNCNSTL
jgi:hypothetical protein